MDDCKTPATITLIKYKLKVLEWILQAIVIKIQIKTQKPDNTKSNNQLSKKINQELHHYIANQKNTTYINNVKWKACPRGVGRVANTSQVLPPPPTRV